MSRPHSRPVFARIDLAALRHNHALARRLAGDARIWNVVKANGYGHGLGRVVRALAEVADGFALIELESAVALRQTGVRQPILMLEGCYAADELPLYVEHGLTPVVHRIEQAAWLAEAKLPVRLPVYVKLNTGMNRLGFEADEFPRALGLLRAAESVGDITLMTHFADADEARGIGEQMTRLNAMRAGLSYPLCLANSAALLRFPESIADQVRPGIMLYGSSPFPQMQSAEALGLLPVMTLESELLAVRQLAAGDRIGYGGSFVAPSAMRVGVVACGYGDGYPRHAPTGTPVLVGGRRTRTLGRVSMDKLCVDLTGLPDAAVGSPVVLWGRGLSADDVATSAGTVSYELFCALAARVPVLEEGLG
jgi:alanine racemase